MMDPTPERLRAVINELGLRDTDVMRITGVSRSTLYRWLRGAAPINVGIMRLLELMTITEAIENPVLKAFLWAAPEGMEEKEARNVD